MSGAATGLDGEAILERLAARYPGKVRAVKGPRGPAFAVAEREHLSPLMTFLRDEPALRFDFLADVTVVDHLLLEVPEVPERFAVVYQLASLAHGHRFQVKVPVPEDDPRVPTLSGLWRSAIWGEREAHDMFGIVFEGHPDLRRLLMPEGYAGFPLRKDYPLRGRGERDSFPQYRPAGAAPHSVDGRTEADRRERPAV